jgi:hypothetical protein
VIDLVEPIDKSLRLEGAIIQAAFQRQHGAHDALRIDGFERPAIDQGAFLREFHVQLNALQQPQAREIVLHRQPGLLCQPAKVFLERELRAFHLAGRISAQATKNVSGLLAARFGFHLAARTAL